VINYEVQGFRRGQRHGVVVVKSLQLDEADAFSVYAVNYRNMDIPRSAKCRSAHSTASSKTARRQLRLVDS
jgi:hypothetical protein